MHQNYIGFGNCFLLKLNQTLIRLVTFLIRVYYLFGLFEFLACKMILKIFFLPSDIGYKYFD